MPDTGTATAAASDWNVVSSPWLETMELDGRAQIRSPQDALRDAGLIRCVSLASPLDYFAAHRFLLTLLYWKAGVAGGVQATRDSLLGGVVPAAIVKALEAESHRFRMFDKKTPFLQDPAAGEGKVDSSPGYLLSELACGTNIAHFHHGDDDQLRLCLRCATLGLLRVVPWTTSGGAGKTPSVHGAPPIIAVALGSSLAITLGLNLVVLDGSAGEPRWTGHFEPSKTAATPYLEAFTWNPRRIHLREPRKAAVCWGCGERDCDAVGAIAYLKNEYTKKEDGAHKFSWQDPAAFYSAEDPDKTIKSIGERAAVNGKDLGRLCRDGQMAGTSRIVAGNASHTNWLLVVPCTTGKDNKTFDHRQVSVSTITPEAIRAAIPALPFAARNGLPGWQLPQCPDMPVGATSFTSAAVSLLSHADWSILAHAAYRGMHEAPAAFDVFSGLVWSLRSKIPEFPSRNAAWLMLKLMAAAPAEARVLRRGASFCPLSALRVQQSQLRFHGQQPVYPASLPQGRRLEADLRDKLDRNLRQTRPASIDWPALCYRLDRLLD